MSLLEQLKKKKENLSKVEEIKDLSVHQLRFDKYWKVISDSKVDNNGPKILKVLQFNIWVDPENKKNRMLILCDLIEELSPDVFAVQENSVQSQDIFKSNSFLQQNYILSDFQGQEEGFKVSLFSKYPFMSLKLNKATVRPYLTGVISFKDLYISFNTCHLSPDNLYSEREKQLNIIYLKNSEFKNSLVLGDFNFHKEDEEKVIYENGYKDVWREIKGTYQSTMRWGPYQLDHVTIRSSDYQAKSIEIIGNEKNKVISDHLGTFTILERN